MRDLRPDGLSEDGRSLLLSEVATTERAAAEGPAERYRVAVDERLRSVLRGRPAANDTRVESALPPREIQARLRAGATVEEVARAAGIPVARVQRYEVPIAAERARVVSQAREATVPPADRTHPGQPLGQLVDAGLTRAGLSPADVTWEARRQPDSSWIVRLPVAERGCAEFSWDAAARRVRPVDDLAHALLAPAPTPPDDAIEAVAEATGVTTGVLDDVPLAVGAENGRRLPGRAAGRLGGGLVVLAGSGEQKDAGAPSDAEQARPRGPAADLPSPEATTPALVGSLLSEPAPGASVPGAVWPPSAPLATSTGARPLGTADDARTVPGGGRAQVQEQVQRPGEAQGIGAEAPDEAPAATTAPSALVTTSAPSTTSAPVTTSAAVTTPVPATPSVRDDALFNAATAAAQSSAEAETPPSAQGSRRRAPGRRGQVPAWDDIVFGAKRS